VRVPILILLGLALALCMRPENHAASATLLEAVEYEPCDYYCGPFNHPRTAYCIDVGGQILVGERAGLLWFGENEPASGRDLVGSQITASFDRRSIWIAAGRRVIKVARGSSFEQFKDSRCLIEVHKPKLAMAAKAIRPRNIPADAFPLAGAQVGEYRSVFVWYSCAMSVDLVNFPIS